MERDLAKQQTGHNSQEGSNTVTSASVQETLDCLQEEFNLTSPLKYDIITLGLYLYNFKIIQYFVYSFYLCD